MENVFNLRDFVNEEEAKEIEKVTGIISAMREKNISCEELSKHIGYSEQEVAEMYNYLNFNNDLLEKADKYLNKLKQNLKKEK